MKVFFKNIVKLEHLEMAVLIIILVNFISDKNINNNK